MEGRKYKKESKRKVATKMEVRSEKNEVKG